MTNLLSIGLMAFAGVWIINRALQYAGLHGLCSNGTQSTMEEGDE
jgi:hypothetical protein